MVLLECPLYHFIMKVNGKKGWEEGVKETWSEKEKNIEVYEPFTYKRSYIAHSNDNSFGNIQCVLFLTVVERDSGSEGSLGHPAVLHCRIFSSPIHTVTDTKCIIQNYSVVLVTKPITVLDVHY